MFMDVLCVESTLQVRSFAFSEVTQGHGKSTPAYSHSLSEDHHVYINLQTLKVYVLPENYQVNSAALDDIKYVVNPTFIKEQVTQLDKSNEEKYTLTNEKYIPGEYQLSSSSDFG
jgi:U4/U6.U5 tri-snRNP-associated protein 2